MTARFVAMALFLGSSLALGQAAEERPQLSAKASMSENLQKLAAAKARVAVVLDGGARIEGQVAEGSADSVVLTALTGKDFYDAVVKISAIAAIEARTRGR